MGHYARVEVLDPHDAPPQIRLNATAARCSTAASARPSLTRLMRTTRAPPTALNYGTAQRGERTGALHVRMRWGV